VNRAFLTLALAVPNALEKPAPFGELWDEKRLQEVVGVGFSLCDC